MLPLYTFNNHMEIKQGENEMWERLMHTFKIFLKITFIALI